MSGTDRHQLAIEALRARVQEEFQISERLVTKGRQSFALAAAFFAITQTVAFGGDQSQHWLIVILAIVAVLLIVATANHVTRLEDVKPERDIRPSAIEEWARKQDDVAFAREMVVHLREVAQKRDTSNAERVDHYEKVAYWNRLALIATAVEMIVAIAIRG